MLHIPLFKEALRNILEKYSPNSKTPFPGLCSGLKQEIMDSNPLILEQHAFDSSYEMMGTLLTGNEYMNRELGPSYFMTEDRWHFGAFALSLSTSELLEIFNAN